MLILRFHYSVLFLVLYKHPPTLHQSKILLLCPIFALIIHRDVDVDPAPRYDILLSYFCGRAAIWIDVITSQPLK